MTRKGKELCLLVALVVILSFLDPIGAASDEDGARAIMGPIIYSVPAAVLTVLISKLVYNSQKKKK